MKQLVCIVGSTGTGKTALALSLARLFPSVLISADSRQLYRGMDIVTGKDHPAGVALWGIDIVSPDEPCSVSVWYEHVRPALTKSKLPIVVGGTGLYIRAVTEGIGTMHIKPDPKLRKLLAKLSVSELQSRMSPAKLDTMNQSDRANPRRLIRAIEINNYHENHPERTQAFRMGGFDIQIIGLQYFDDSNHRSVVRKRVVERLDSGAVEETEELLKTYSHELPSMSALGYKHITKFLSQELTRDELIDVWTHDELSYAKRQRTWFNKIPNIHWFEASDPTVSDQVAKLLKSWYHYDR